MFSATITGKIKRVLFDNNEDGKDAMMKVVVETRKQYVKQDDMPNVYPVVAIFGFDAAYLRDYAGQGHWAHFYNCDLDVYRPEDKSVVDEDGKETPYDQISFKAGKCEILPKEMAEAVADTIEEDDDEGGSRGRGKKKKSRGGSSKGKGKSRSQRRGRNRDEDDEEEEEKPRRRKQRGKASDGAKKGRKRKPVEEDYDDDYDEDYDDDDFDDDDDEYFE